MVIVLPETGMQGIAFDSLPAPLPTGLPDGASITVVEVGLATDRLTPVVIVEDERGIRWDLCLSQMNDTKFPSTRVHIDSKRDRRSESVA